MLRLAHGYWALWDGLDRAAQLEHWEKAALLQPHLSPDLRVSHLSAGELWGFPLSRGMTWIHDLLDEPLYAPRYDLRPHLSTASGRSSRSPGGYVTHRGIGLPSVVGLWECQVTSALETLLALQTVLPGWRGVAVVDFVLAHGLSMDAKRPLTVSRHQEMVDDLPPGTHGVRALRQALGRSAERTWSPMETVLRLLVEHFGFPAPVPNFGVSLADQTMAYIDLAWPDYKVGLEYNGSGHYLNAAYAEEMHRCNQLGEADWRIRNVVVNDLKLPHRVHSLHDWLARSLPKL